MVWNKGLMGCDWLIGWDTKCVTHLLTTELELAENA